MISWRDLDVRSLDGNHEITGEDRDRLIEELHLTGGMMDAVLGRLDGQDPGDPSAWGPGNDEIDWTGFGMSDLERTERERDMAIV